MRYGVYRQGVALVLAVVLTAMLGAAHARDLAMDPDDMVPVELATIGVDRAGGTPLVLLREPESGDVVPIRIGLAEARAILMAQQDMPVPRPQTHDLIGNVLEGLDATLERVLVDDLSDGIYYGMLELSVAGRDEPVLVDTRPSDALALAVRTGARILVSPEILQAGQDLEYEGIEDDQVVTALGITVVEATDDLRDALDIGDQAGVIVSGVRGHAAHVGLTEGSLIVAVNDETPETPMDFLDLVRDTPSGERARIRYVDEGEEREIEVPTDVPDRRRDEGITL
ncbi:bifunctional nuclease domain-containing protein [Aquisalimonas asiatica]|uniref:Bifunctional DNase/RNase n=1 Tax=Aquisalimonas asiatica TaxID=406100 RepID=A0A1H8TQS9_9GAMM|nr:bifunctional nuclease domain-containing protein [Aquisalimonas asiatica]SEO92788.1 Bifunctional DNase/RNase [Aquisalimonas asiatica]